MDSCPRHPPNSQRFNDDVVAGVVQRVRRSNSSFDAHVGSCPPRHQNLWPRTGEHKQMRRPVTTYEQRQWEAPSQGTQATDWSILSQDAMHKALAELILSEKVRLRELRRLRQVRYRKKKENYAHTLEKETYRLRNETEKLELERCGIPSVAPSADSVLVATAEYFRLFRHGFHGTSDMCNQQENFVRSTMAPDVVFNVKYGPEAITETWKFISEMLEGVALELVSLDMGDTGSLVAGTRTTVTITEQTLRYLFPHLHRKNDVVLLKLAEKLLEQRIAMRATTRFAWDSTRQRISSPQYRYRYDAIGANLCKVLSGS
ncbi:hypothetical protein PC121_g23548 [Phytophthora cactorum]|nr:hypothetical protein PC120_g25988 [Phytophthora cactorum]KAG3040570.1 hypothetical protein PC121_g23548 [Phytophthora cactorum]